MLNRFYRSVTLMSFVLGAVLLTGKANAEEPGGWHAESETYRAYLGVVPASLIKRQPVLVDGDRALHGGAAEQSGASQHVMVALYRKSDNARVVGATVIAEVKRAKLLGGAEQETPLERMATTGGITYGNYFDMPEQGAYDIELTIYESNRNGGEEVEFSYVRP